MDNTGPVSVSTHKSSQRKFFQWAVKWFYADQTEDITVKPDAPELACLLQAIGFQLREFDKQEDNNGRNKTKNDTIKVIIECGSSKMRAVMELDDVICQCPNQDDAKDASFWSVSGTGPLGSMENMNKVVETGSNLLPSISKGDANVLRDVTQHLLKLIKNIPDVNQNTDSNLNLASIENSLKLPSNNEAGLTPLTRRHTQPDFNTGRCRSLDTLTKNNEMENIKSNSPSPVPPQDVPMLRNRSSSDSRREPQKASWHKLSLKEEMESADPTDVSPIASPAFPMPLQRQKTFDMDISTLGAEGEPRPSPPKLASSPVPVPQLCMSLGQISLQSDGKEVSLVEMLFRAKSNLELALRMLANSPQASNTISEDLFLKPAPPRNSSSFRISPGNNTSRPESSCSLPVNSMSRNSGLQKSSVRRNVAQSFRRTSDGVKSPADKKSTPTNRSLLQRRSLGSRLTVPKPLGLKIDTPRPVVKTGNVANSSTSRTIIAAKRRVSPDPKNSPSQIQKPNTSMNTSSLQKNSLSSHSKLQSNIASPRNPSGSGIAANKFGFTKKKI